MKHALFITIAALVSACGAPKAPETTAPEGPPVEARAPQMILEPLAEADITGKLTGELGCSFSKDGATLVLAKGDVSKTATSQAVIKRNGAATLLPATKPGGYDGMVEGASFADQSAAVDIRPNTGTETGNEQVSYDATLTLRAEGGEQSLDGQWTCGP